MVYPTIIFTIAPDNEARLHIFLSAAYLTSLAVTVSGIIETDPPCLNMF